MMKTSSEISAILLKYKDQLIRLYNVKEIGLFGSYVRNEQTAKSDVDILIDFNEVPDLMTFIEIEEFLRKLIKKKVDLVHKRNLKKEVRDNVLREVVYI